MKKLFVIIGFALMMIILLVAFKITNDTVTITTDRNLYIPTMSSVRGIKMTPDFKSVKKYVNLEYHWTADQGEFISDFAQLGKDVKNQGQTVLWSAIENDVLLDIKNIKSPFNIRLQVVDGDSQKILANTKLSINTDTGFYGIKK